MSVIITSRYFLRKAEPDTCIQMPRPHLKEAPRKQAAVSHSVQNPSRTASRNDIQHSETARPTATVPPNNSSLSAGTVTTISDELTIISVIPSPTPRNISNTITVDRFPRSLNSEVSIIRLPNSTNERTESHSENQGSDDVVYLYTVDSRPTQSLAEEVDLTQESQAGNTEPSKTTVTKARKNRKRKLEGDGATKKRKMIDDAQPVCSLCNIHNESLTVMAEKMFLGSCGHLFCSPCTRKIKANDCETCGKKINALRKVFF